MAATPAPNRLSRSIPFTPKRPLSSATSSELPSAIKTSVLGSTAKKFKSVLSSESRLRTTVLSKPSLAPVPATPAKKSFEGARPRTPGTPNRSQTPNESMNTSDMDVSRIDPEEALVDFQTVEAGDVSADIDEGAIPGPNYGKDDKVLVSIRSLDSWIIFLILRPLKFTEFAPPPPHISRGTTMYLDPSSFSLNTPNQLLAHHPNSILTKSLLALIIGLYIMLSLAAMSALPWTDTTLSFSHTVKLPAEKHSLS